MSGIALNQNTSPPTMGWSKTGDIYPPDYINIDPFEEKVKSVPKNTFLVLLNTIINHSDTW